ncbi:uncharacterized protein BO80DRAFT_32330 [Aspergillus ibericus CBS 121593]|uniref:Uncharacterized protein n=1 Tax=Aspergillus ibericus CBS 121593 TaxID=1448316 RepID=A0A395H5Y2_9EURO|nr:hypothetical protein BO80DRAFT_32330 [Aspergillus ibericus CBS 121593]RAL02328.1 hypothetical protein BO80DRAFT_32330 [Aspergillus ibericus CBS 121593]
MVPRKRQRRLSKRHQPLRYTPEVRNILSKEDLTRNVLSKVDRESRLPPSNSRPLEFAPTILRRCTPSCLAEIKALARQGGPDLSDLRRYPGPKTVDGTLVFPKRNSPAESETYGGSLTMPLIDNGIYPIEHPAYDRKAPASPQNLDAIKQRLSRRRASLTESSFTDADFKQFRHIEANQAYTKASIDTFVLPTIWGDKDPNYRFRLCHGRTCDHLAPFSKIPLPFATPDYYRGVRYNQLHTEVRDELHKQIIPWQDEIYVAPFAPNFFVEVGDPDDPTSVCHQKASYAGAIGSRAVQALQSYNRAKTVYDGQAYTITAVYANGMLSLYAHHVIPHVSSATISRRSSDYIMTQLGAWSMIQDAATFREGATAFRNAFDWTSEELGKVVDLANEMQSLGPEEVPVRCQSV